MLDPLARARAHLQALARAPRPAGSAADADARAYAARTLASLGFTTREAAFSYSQFPGRLATPGGGAIATGALMAAGHMGNAGSPRAALLLLAGAAVLLGAAGAWLARRGVLAFPLMRARDANLVATRGTAEPRVWLVAHTDSKSQPVPSGVRAGGIVLLALAAVAMAAVAATSLVRETPAATWTWVAATLAGIAGGIPVMLSVVGARSPGALDNASGVAAVLLAAELLPATAPVGVVVTAAEELGLAGARAWAAGAKKSAAILNCDGVDDVGELTGMFTGRRAGRVLAAFGRAAAASGVRYRSMRLIPGILVDAVAMADAGFEAATLSRGTLATLGRIHTPRDDLARMSGAGIPEAARVLAGAAVDLATQGDR